MFKRIGQLLLVTYSATVLSGGWSGCQGGVTSVTVQQGMGVVQVLPCYA